VAVNGLQTALLLGGLASLALASLLGWRALAARIKAGLPAGRIVYADTRRWARCEPLYSTQYRLAGKPDYVLRQGRTLIPIEVKPGRDASQPYPADVMQLMAYCLLVEESTGQPPSHGLLRYRERTFRIPYDPRGRQALLDTLRDMRQARTAADVPRSHHDAGRCRFCGQREACGASLLD
jgi:CRISPR-associated exonuclease Cas4